MKRVFDVHMIHFHQDLGHQDATVERHYVPRRLFKISDDLFYPTVEHPVLMGDFKEVDKCEVTIFHLAHITACFNIKKRYVKNLSHSNIHSKEFLDAWNKAHILGFYPNKPVDPKEIPEVILKYFNINKDEIYFKDRQIEFKHALMVRQWFEYFNPQSVLDIGAGRGPYMYFWKWFVPGQVKGFELSSYAVKNAFTSGIEQKDISEDWNLSFHEGKINGKVSQLAPYDLITAVDVLEHLTDDQLNKTLANMYKYGNKFLFSIPYIGDPNLAADRTHLQHRTKQDWIKLLEGHGFKISDPPTHWYFKEQILVGTK